MSWVRIWVHLVFSTKNREPFLQKSIRQNVFDHIRENARSKNIWIDSINGHVDHVHCLISLDREHSISQVAQLIKGESSYWINKNKLTPMRFSWQNDYWAEGVGEEALQRTRLYIWNQEYHHTKKTFAEEVNEFQKSIESQLGENAAKADSSDK